MTKLYEELYKAKKMVEWAAKTSKFPEVKGAAWTAAYSTEIESAERSAVETADSSATTAAWVPVYLAERQKQVELIKEYL